jgi:hypothetical protein
MDNPSKTTPKENFSGIDILACVDYVRNLTILLVIFFPKISYLKSTIFFKIFGEHFFSLSQHPPTMVKFVRGQWLGCQEIYVINMLKETRLYIHLVFFHL